METTICVFGRTPPSAKESPDKKQDSGGGTSGGFWALESFSTPRRNHGVTGLTLRQLNEIVEHGPFIDGCDSHAKIVIYHGPLIDEHGSLIAMEQYLLIFKYCDLYVDI